MSRLWGLVVGLVVLLGILFVVGKQMTVRVETVLAPKAPLGPHARFLETDLGRVHILDNGAGDTVLLLHGSGSSIANWQEGFAERLAENHRVIGFDNFGFGMSDRDHPYRYGNALFAEQAIAVLDALGIEQVVVLGHSAGGVVAAILAADHPSRVRGAVLVGHGVAIDPGQLLSLIPGVGEMQLALTPIADKTFSDTHTKRLAAAYHIRGTRAAFLTFVRRQYTIDGLRLLTGTYEDIHVPVLQIHGEMDKSIPITAARDLGNRLSDTKLIAFKNAGHYVYMDAPQDMAAAVTSFVESLSR